MPAAEEEGHRHRRDDEHLDVLGQREGAVAHAAVLGLVPLHQLGVGLGEVERRPAGLRESGDHEDQEADDLRDHVPDLVLRLDDRDERQGARHHDRPQERQAHRDLVRDQLRRRAHRAQEAVLGARGPAAEQQPVEGDRAEGEEVEDPDRDVDAVEADPVLDVPERDDRQGRNAGEDDDRRGDRPQDRNRVLGPVALLGDQLHRVGQRLQQAERPDPVGPVARLEATQDLALDHRQDRRDREHGGEDHDRLHHQDPGRLGEAHFGNRQRHASPSGLRHLDRLARLQRVRVRLRRALDQEPAARPHPLADRDARPQARPVRPHVDLVALREPEAVRVSRRQVQRLARGQEPQRRAPIGDLGRPQVAIGADLQIGETRPRRGAGSASHGWSRPPRTHFGERARPRRGPASGRPVRRSPRG